MRQDEHNEQVRLFAWAGREAEERPELGLLFAVPNGGRRDKVTGIMGLDRALRNESRPSVYEGRGLIVL